MNYKFKIKRFHRNAKIFSKIVVSYKSLQMIQTTLIISPTGHKCVYKHDISTICKDLNIVIN